MTAKSRSQDPAEAEAASSSAGPSTRASNCPWAQQTPPIPAASNRASAPSSSSSSFPSLASAATRTRRQRASPWSSHYQGHPINPYPSRAQEIAHRVLGNADFGGDGVVRQRDRKVHTLHDDDGAGQADLDVEDAHSGPVQMYGLSRVTVKDLSRPDATGRNKMRREDLSSASPQIYSRHNQPWVQKAKRPASSQSWTPTAGTRLFFEDDEDDVGAAGPPLAAQKTLDDAEERRLDSLSLAEVVAQCERLSRTARLSSDHQIRSSDASSNKSSQVFSSLLAKLTREADSEDGIGRLAELCHQQTTMYATMTSLLPTNVAQDCHEALTASIVERCHLAHLERRGPPRPFCSLLLLSLDLASTSESALRSLLRIFGGANQSDLELLLESTPLVVLNATLARLTTSLSSRLEQHRLAGDQSYPAITRETLALLRYLHKLHKIDDFRFCIQELSENHHSKLVRAGELEFLLPFSQRVQLLKQTCESVIDAAQKQATFASFYSPSHSRSAPQSDDTLHRHDRNVKVLHIARTRALEDTLSAVQTSTSNLWDWQLPLRVHFVGEEGMDSALGGLTREWFRVVTRSLVIDTLVFDRGDTASSVGAADYARVDCVNLSPQGSEEHVQVFGLLLGLSLLHQVPLGLRLSDHIMQVLMHSGDEDWSACVQRSELENDLSMLAHLKPQLVQGVLKMLQWAPSAATAGQEAEAQFQQTFSLNWTVNISEAAGLSRVVPLRSGGQHHSVTYRDRKLYAHSLVRFHLYQSIQKQLDALRLGFQKVWPIGLPPSVDVVSDIYRRLSPVDVALVVRGDGLDVLDTSQLRRYVDVVNLRRGGPGAVEDTELLQSFWAAVAALQEESTSSEVSSRVCFTRQLAAFVTASEQLPLWTMFSSSSDTSVQRCSALFSIHLVDIDYMPSSLAGDDPSALPLPWASTCTATLFLPRAFAGVADGAGLLKAKLGLAVQLSEEGFGLR
ncbi:unnamed protein product [Parajaminaea phylloscopi]